MAGQTISDTEIALIKAMLATGEFSKDRIQAHFTRPDRVLNFGRITDIERGKRGARVEAATAEELDNFLKGWIASAECSASEAGPFSVRAMEALLRIDSKAARVQAYEFDRVEFKLSWNAGSADDYAKSMAAFANSKGGYLIFGVRDGTGEIVGLSSDKFEKYDPARFSSRYMNLSNPI